MSAFEKLLSQWADEQGFQTFAQDHSAVLRNLAKWLNRNYGIANPNPARPVHKDSITAGEVYNEIMALSAHPAKDGEDA